MTKACLSNTTGNDEYVRVYVWVLNCLEGPASLWLNRMERMTTVYVCYKKQLAYYRDYNQQMKGWPILPVDVAVSWLRKKPKNWRVADFGCGEARLEKSVSQVLRLFSATD